MAKDNIRLETIDTKAKKKKTKIIIWGMSILLIVLFGALVITLIKVQKEKVFKTRQKQAELKKELKIIQKPEFKENWAISMENRQADLEKKIEEMNKKFQENQIKVFTEIKKIIQESSTRNEQRIEKMKSAIKSDLEKFKKEIKDTVAQQNEKIASLEIMMETLKTSKGGEGGEEIVIGPEVLPELPEEMGAAKVKKMKKKKGTLAENEKKAEKQKGKQEGQAGEETAESIAEKIIKTTEKLTEKKSKKKKSSKMAFVDIDTSFNKRIVKEQMSIEKEEEPKEEEEQAMHLTIGMSQAYLITGVYAPVFQEGTEEPLPVLLEAEGNIILANNVRGSFDKCFLIGSAKGDMNSQTAKIRLEKISCLLDGGDYRIEGSIKGWVVNEDGIPGIKGELLHKNGAWIARTFVAGFLETFSTAITTANVETINFGGGTTTGVGTNGQTSTANAIGTNSAVAAGSGLAQVFKKLGDYYLKMAEQIFPVIEVKGGRTVDIMLLGGEDFKAVKNRVVDVHEEESLMIEKELKKGSKKSNIVLKNAFTRAIMGESSENIEGNELNGQEGKGNGSEIPSGAIDKVKIPE